VAVGSCRSPGAGYVGGAVGGRPVLDGAPWGAGAAELLGLREQLGAALCAVREAVRPSRPVAGRAQREAEERGRSRLAGARPSALREVSGQDTSRESIDLQVLHDSVARRRRAASGRPTGGLRAACGRPRREHGSGRRARQSSSPCTVPAGGATARPGRMRSPRPSPRSRGMPASARALRPNRSRRARSDPRGTIPSTPSGDEARRAPQVDPKARSHAACCGPGNVARPNDIFDGH
jgi:hypothetical protein